jgi:hypothetical protein
MAKPYRTQAQISGLDDFQQRAAKLSNKALDACRKAIEETAEMARWEATADVPTVTHRLQKTIRVEVSDTGLTAFVKAGGKKAPYAHLVEFGHKKPGGGMVAAVPFLTPAGERARRSLGPMLAQILAEEDL